ncbi:MAG: fimbrillin family protein [Bacteroidales bacterium]|nr:fimbrillin family protein [Bacteroidales bacterium]
MKTIYNKTIIAAMALVFTVSCQGLQDITTPDTTGDDAREIKFKSVSVPMAAGQQSVVSAGLFAGDPINMDNVRLDINASGQVTPQTPIMWAPGQEKSTDFLAYSPYDETYSIRSEVKFAVKADQSTAAASAASDLLVAQALSKPADGAVALNFEHKLSQISVYLDNRTGKDITRVTFASLVDNVVLDLNTGDVTAGSSTSDIVAYNDADRKCYSVIVPAGTFALDLKITLSDSTVLSRKTDELSFVAGKSYDNANEPLVLEDSVVEPINVNLSVSDWTYGGNVSFDEYEKEPVFEIYDAGWNVISDFSTINIPSDGGKEVLFVNSNVNWDASSSADWLNVSPISFAPVGDDASYVEVDVTAAANSGEPRSATITFSVEGQQGVVITVNQEKMVPFTAQIELMLPSEFFGAPDDRYPDWSCFISHIGMPTAPVVAGGYGLWKKSAWDDLLSNWEDNIEEVIAIVDEYGGAFTAADLEEINDLENGGIYWLFSNQIPETEYILVTKLVDANDRVYINYSIKATTAEPEIPYTGELVLGNYLMTDNESLDQPSSNVFTLKTADGGDTNYLLTKVCVQEDNFNWKAVYDKSAGTLTMSGEAVGYESYGPLWFYTLFSKGSYGAGYIGSGESGEEPVVFTVDPATKQINGLASGSEIRCFAASGSSILGYFTYFTAETTTITYQSSVSAGDYLCRQSGIVNAAKNAVQHSVFEMPRLLGKQTFKAHKAIR